MSQNYIGFGSPLSDYEKYQIQLDKNRLDKKLLIRQKLPHQLDKNELKKCLRSSVMFFHWISHQYWIHHWISQINAKI